MNFGVSLWVEWVSWGAATETGSLVVHSLIRQAMPGFVEQGRWTMDSCGLHGGSERQREREAEVVMQARDGVYVA